MRWKAVKPLLRAGAVLALALLAGAGAVLAQEQPRITLNLKEADISALINTVADVTGRNFVVDPRVRARVTVISKRAMEPEELYRVFLSILQVHGFSAVPSGEVTKIVPDVNAKQLGQEGAGVEPDAVDELVTRVIPVDNVPVAQLVPILRPLVPQQGHFAAYPPTNVLIISDRVANVERMERIIRRIDRESPEELEVVRLENAQATEMVRILSALQQGQQAQQRGTPAVQLAADERTNSVLMSGDSATRLRFRTIIAHLDTPLQGGGDTRVVYLRYAKAEDLVEVLQGVSENVPREGAEGAAAQGGAAARGARDDVSIQADPNTNALVITAPASVQRELDSVIQKLDVRRAQVLIEAAIAEISMDTAAELGLQWAVDGTQSNDAALGGTNFTVGSQGSSLAGLLGAVAQDSFPAIGAGLSVAVGNLSGGTRFAALLRALESEGETNILSTPTLVTLDNEEAEIRVAQNVPFITGSFTTDTSGAQNPFQTVEREDVGIILRVTPQINEGDAVQLEIEQEVSSVSSSAQAVDLITNKRTIKTSVLVDDGQLIILGGLIDDQVRENEQRVPLLGSIPVIGELFRYRSSSRRKQNLMVFLRPRIVREPAIMSRYTGNKYSYMRAQQVAQQARGVDLLQGVEVPTLPPLEERPELPHPFPQER